MGTIIVTLDKIFLTFAEGYSSQSKSDIAGSSIHLLKTAAENRSRAGSANEPISEVSGGSQTSTASDSCKQTNKRKSFALKEYSTQMVYRAP